MDHYIDHYIEPEQRIEDAIVSHIKLHDILCPVLGVLESCQSMADVLDSYVYVKVDQTSLDLDFTGARVPHTYTATIGVRIAQADSKSGSNFVKICRQIRQSIDLMLGDGCDRLSQGGFFCDSVTLESTATEFDGGDNPINIKSYTLRIVGRTTL